MLESKYFGFVIGVNPKKIELYKQLHSDEDSGVRDLLVKYNISNFSIFIHRLDDGKEYLFGYYEYLGNNYEEDMAGLAFEPRNIEWLKICDPCQKPLKNQSSWALMERIYHND